MGEDRRYSDEEVAAILTAASAEDATPSPQGGRAGLTLSELQDIGSEVGLSPVRIREAAIALDRGGAASQTSTVMGLPRAVARVVPIPRALTDHEWTRLVVDLRETFNAKGRIESHGLLRSWTNGNLQVHVEPEAEGYRVRMQTLKGDAGGLVGFSALFTVVALVVLAVLVVLDAVSAGPLFLSAFLALLGVGAGVNAAVALPRWARERTEQMEGLAHRIPDLLTESEDTGVE